MRSREAFAYSRSTGYFCSGCSGSLAPVTGTTFFSNVLTAKRLTLLRDLVPSAVDIAVLMNPTNANADTDRDELQTAARAPGLLLKLLPASNEKEIDAAFAAMAQDRPAALFVVADAYFFGRSE